jgi:hypothetical protein
LILTKENTSPITFLKHSPRKKNHFLPCPHSFIQGDKIYLPTKKAG